jgi:hypothetical protein
MTNRQQSKYAEHILNTEHTYNTIDTTLKILHTEKKNRLLDTWERYHIYNFSKKRLHVNDTFANQYNPIFELIINNNRGNAINNNTYSLPSPTDTANSPPLPTLTP